MKICSEMEKFCFFYGIIFIAFGLGITLSQLLGDKLVSGLFFLVIGFILLILIIPSNQPNYEQMKHQPTNRIKSNNRKL